MPIFQPNIASLKAKRDGAGLVRALDNKDAKVRRAAIEALGEIRSPHAVAPLCRLLLANDTDHADKIIAAAALGAIGDAAAVDALLKADTISLQRERERIAAANAKTERAYRPGFYVNLISTDEFSLRSAIAMALASIGGESALRALFEMLAAEMGPMEGTARAAFKAQIEQAVEKAGNAACQVLYDQLTSRSLECRQAAAKCLGDLDAQAIERLAYVALDESEHFSVRQTAILSLGKIDDLRALPFLDDLSEVENQALAREAQNNAAAIRQRHKKTMFHVAS